MSMGGCEITGPSYGCRSGDVATSWYQQASRRNLRPFRSHDAPLIVERAATRRQPPRRPPTFNTATPAADDATRDAHGRRWPPLDVRGHAALAATSAHGTAAHSNRVASLYTR
jgi:hypothetical protein